MVENNEIQISICCLVYNHEKYLRQCLDGFMMQEGVSFEVLIHDDASTDHSADIIREYEDRYPSVIKPIIQIENKLSKGIGISKTYQYPRARGKYIALCEGDDFWTNTSKLKRQFDEMESHPECKMSVHDVQRVNEDGSQTEIFYPNYVIEDTIIESDDFFKYVCKKTRYPFHTSSYFFNASELKKYADSQPSFTIGIGVGDLPMLLYFAQNWPICYINENMSSHRMGAKDSWNNRIYADLHKRALHYNNLVRMYRKFEEYSGRKGCFNEDINYYNYLYYLLEKDYSKALKILRKNPSLCDNRREKLSIVEHVYFPHIYSMYRKLKNKK